MNIQFEETATKAKFFIEEGGERLGVMHISKAGPTRWIIDHTEVSEKLRGKGAGLQLVKAGVEYAREHGLKIIPLCPFAKSIIEKRPDFQDVLDK